MIFSFDFNVTKAKAILVVYATSGYVCTHCIKIEILGANYTIIDQIRHGYHLDCYLNIDSNVLHQLQLSRVKKITVYDHEQKIRVSGYKVHHTHKNIIYLAFLALTLLYCVYLLLRNK